MSLEKLQLSLTAFHFRVKQILSDYIHCTQTRLTSELQAYFRIQPPPKLFNNSFPFDS